jgi:hypothetical protein
MKTTQRGATLLTLTFAIGLCLIANAQPQNISQNDTLAELQPLAPENVPDTGTFFMLQSYLEDGNSPPYPFNPNTNAPVFYLGGNSYMVDNTSMTNDAQVLDAVQTLMQPGSEQMLSAMSSEMEPSSFSASPSMESMSAFSFSSNTLWLEIPSVTNGSAQLVVHGTVEDVSYEILSRTNLSDTNWLSEKIILGAAGQDWTPTSIPKWDRTNSLFFWARSWGDSDGSGLPDWWQLQYFGHTGVDPYGDADNDGWNNLQEFQNGTNPNSFNTPPPPQNVQARLDTTHTNVILSWRSGGGPVDHYGIENDWAPSEIGTASASTTEFVDAPNFGSYQPIYIGEWYPGPEYRIRAYFSNGSSALSAPTRVEVPQLTFTCQVVQGESNALYLVVQSPSPELAKLHFTWNSGPPPFPSFELSATNLINGVLRIPPEQAAAYPYSGLYVQGLSANNEKLGEPVSCYTYDNNEIFSLPQTNFISVAVQMKENLKFLLRAATITQPFCYATAIDTRDYEGSSYYILGNRYYPNYWYARPQSSTNYEYYGFHTFSSFNNFAFIEFVRPVKENFLWRNFAYAPQNFNASGILTNGVTGEADDNVFLYVRELVNPKYRYTGGEIQANTPALLDASTTTWLFRGNLAYLSGDEDWPPANELSIYLDSTNHPVIPSGVRNCYGLALNSIRVRTNAVYAPGASLPTFGALFLNFEQPDLQAVDYYFTSQTPFFNFNPWPYDSYAPPAMPGSPTFSPANAPLPLIAGFGQPITISGWAKMAILNGYTNKFAYLEQYLDKAYTIGTNGIVTTNSAGIVSPYGSFFPTMPGTVALVTMPDIDPPYQRGTGVVNVIKLQLDVNHDGVMDLSFGRPDNTSVARPYVHWVNNNFDRKHNVDGSDVDEDDLEFAGAPGNENGIVPDYTYGTFVPFVGIVPSIPCEKDLEDYARLWIPGLSNIMAVMPSSYTVKLTLTGDGAIRLFRAIELDGGSNYLFNPVTASNQVAQSASLYVGLLNSSSPITLTNQSEHYIWCGVQRGSAQIDLQIFDGTNMVADTTAYFELKDIKEMYERWTLGDSPSRAPTNTAFCAAEGLPLGVTPFQYGASDSTNTPYILFVHGWNMALWEKDRFAETAFKRLYWQGYQGRFGNLRWPTYYDFPAEAFSAQAFNPQNYDNSEYNAWRSAQGLLNKLSELNAKYPGHVYLLAHSMGNVVAGEALRLSGTSRVVNTYVASQAAVPGHTYDNSLPDYSFTYIINYGPFTPNIYTNWFSSNSGAASRRINYYNTNDYALQRPRWEWNQLFKPDTSTFGWTYGFNGYPHTGYPNSATNHYTAGVDDTPPWNYFFKENFFGTDVYLDIVNVLTNRYEGMAYAAQARSTALGRTAGVQNLSQTLDLQTVWPPDSQNLSSPYSAHKWHSAQFRSTNMEEYNYWNTLLYSVKGFNLLSP